MSLNIELFPLVGRPPAVTYLVSYRRHLTSSSVLKINNLSLLILNHPNYFEPTVSLQYCRRHLTSSSVLKINNLSLLILNHPNYFEPTVSLQYCPFYVANQIIGLSFNIV